MPNWCNNMLTIRAPKETLDIIERGARNNKLLQTLAPLPPHDPSTEGYVVQVCTWGTKWEIRSPEIGIDRHADFITLHFNSAWRPPITALETAVQHLDIIELEMLYIEGGVGFCGVAEYYEDAGFEVNTYDTPNSIEERDDLIAQEPKLDEWIREYYDDDFFSEEEEDA